jgi:hypothetical protein
MRLVTAVTLPCLLLISISVSAQDQNCSEQSVKGTYGFTSSIRLVPPPNSSVKQTAHTFIGLISYDGAGEAEASGITLAANGNTNPYAGAGTYKVNAQRCSGAVIFQDKPGNKPNGTSSSSQEQQNS